MRRYHPEYENEPMQQGTAYPEQNYGEYPGEIYREEAPQEYRVQADQEPAYRDDHELYQEPLDLDLAPQGGTDYAQADEDYADIDPEAEKERQESTQRVLHMISVIVGIAVIVICAVLLIGLISWIRKDVSGSLVLLQSGLH